ncbi:15282_t:CDS:2 [Acaulospora colombiana]|uniref:15282_t:CDS:1 n=1 Tax=Acaulospora colombiana TaxID=27376 RepID=A0ACA9L406_9GLOM|nr:15282_t:CDS:2 [Acaulospora colombiana]
MTLDLYEILVIFVSINSLVLRGISMQHHFVQQLRWNNISNLGWSAILDGIFAHLTHFLWHCFGSHPKSSYDPRGGGPLRLYLITGRLC